MMPDPVPSEADRIALRKMFKAIAEFGRSVRLRRQAEGYVPPLQETSSELILTNKPEVVRRAQKQRRKGRSRKR